MPELPEVEFAARNLRQWLVGKTILRASLAPTRVLKRLRTSVASRALEGRRVLEIDRRGKWLRIRLDCARKLELPLNHVARPLATTYENEWREPRAQAWMQLTYHVPNDSDGR